MKFSQRYLIPIAGVCTIASCNLLSSGPGNDESLLRFDAMNLAEFGEPYEVPPQAPHPFRVTVDVPADVRVGEAVPMKLILRNVGDSQATLEVASPGGAIYWGQ